MVAGRSFVPQPLRPGIPGHGEITRNFDAIAASINDLRNGAGGDELPGSYTYAEMRLIAADEGDIIKCKGRMSAGDGAEGLFIFIASVAADDGGYILSCPGGHWRRITEYITPEMFGARLRVVATDSTDDTLALRAMATCAKNNRLEMRLAGTTYATTGKAYRISDTIELDTFPTCPTMTGKNNQLAGSTAVFTTLYWDGTVQKSGTGATVGASAAGFSPLDGNLCSLCTVTGLSGITADDVGSWIFFPNIAPRTTPPFGYPTQIRALQILQRVSATEVVALNITGITGAAQAWMIEKRCALRTLSPDSKIQGINVAVAPGKLLFAGFESTKSPTGQVQTNGQYSYNACGANGTNSWCLFGHVHMNSYAQPGAGPWEFNGENGEWYQCTFAYNEVAGIYCPNMSGQAQKNIIRQCNLTQVPIGIYWESGGFLADRCDISTNGWACVKGRPGHLAWATLDHCVSEASFRFVDIEGNNPNMSVCHIVGGYYATTLPNIDSTGVIRFGGCGTLTIENVNFDGYVGNDPSFKILVSNPEDGGATVRAPVVRLIGSHFPNMDPVASASNCVKEIQNCWGRSVTNVKDAIPDEHCVPMGLVVLYTRPAPRYGYAGAMGATLASAALITPDLVNVFYKMSGTTAVEHIRSTGHNPGRTVEFYVTDPAGLVFRHNVGPVPATYASIITKTGADVTIAQRNTFRAIYDGTNWLEV